MPAKRPVGALDAVLGSSAATTAVEVTAPLSGVVALSALGTVAVLSRGGVLGRWNSVATCQLARDDDADSALPEALQFVGVFYFPGLPSDVHAARVGALASTGLLVLLVTVAIVVAALLPSAKKTADTTAVAGSREGITENGDANHRRLPPTTGTEAWPCRCIGLGFAAVVSYYVPNIAQLSVIGLSRKDSTFASRAASVLSTLLTVSVLLMVVRAAWAFNRVPRPALSRLLISFVADAEDIGRLTHRLVGFVDLVAASALGMVSGFNPTSSGINCLMLAVAMCAVSTATLAYFILVRPFVAFKDLAFATGLWSIVLISSLVSLAATRVGPVHLQSMTLARGWLDIMAVAVLGVQAIVEVVVTLRSRMMRKTLQMEGPVDQPLLGDPIVFRHDVDKGHVRSKCNPLSAAAILRA